MLARIANEEPRWCASSGNEQVKFEHILDRVGVFVVESGYADAAVLDLKDLDLEILLDCGQELGVDEGFAAGAGIDQRVEFELYAVLREMAFGRECWAAEYVVQSDSVSARGFVGCSLG